MGVKLIIYAAIMFVGIVVLAALFVRDCRKAKKDRDNIN